MGRRRFSRSQIAALCEAVVVKHGRSQAYVEATLTRESGGEIVARATAVNLFLDPTKKG